MDVEAIRDRCDQLWAEFLQQNEVEQIDSVYDWPGLGKVGFLMPDTADAPTIEAAARKTLQTVAEHIREARRAVGPVAYLANWGLLFLHAPAQRVCKVMVRGMPVAAEHAPILREYDKACKQAEAEHKAGNREWPHPDMERPKGVECPVVLAGTIAEGAQYPVYEADYR